MGSVGFVIVAFEAYARTTWLRPFYQGTPVALAAGGAWLAIRAQNAAPALQGPLSLTSGTLLGFSWLVDQEVSSWKKYRDADLNTLP